MAGESASTSFEYDQRQTPDEWVFRNIGPYNHAATGGFLPLTASSNLITPLTTDRPYVIDSVKFVAETIAAAARTVRLAWANDGQTMAAAVSASQFVTSAFDLNTLVAGTLSAATIDRTNNLIPAGARLFLVTGSTSDTALAGLNIHIRLRTLVR